MTKFLKKALKDIEERRRIARAVHRMMQMDEEEEKLKRQEICEKK